MLLQKLLHTRDLIALRSAPLARPLGAVPGGLFRVETDLYVHDYDLQALAPLRTSKMTGPLYRDCMFRTMFSHISQPLGAFEWKFCLSS